MLRRAFLALAVTLGVGLLLPAGRAEAQFFGGGGNIDPFQLYFGYYLPHQAYVAAQPTPLDTINQVTAARQYSAVTDRAGLYDPISPYGAEELDPLRPYDPKRGGERLARPGGYAGSSTNANGSGPATHYNRTARYYPHLRASRGPNRNLSVSRGSRGGGGGGFPSAPSAGGFAGPHELVRPARVAGFSKLVVDLSEPLAPDRG